MCNNITFHADDYGFSEVIDKSIIKSISNGYINSISIAISENVNFLEEILNSNIKLSLHINLTTYTKNNLNNLKDENLNFLKIIFASKSLRKKIKNEIDFQINLFRSTFNKTNIKVDGHQHIHMIPWVYQYLYNNPHINQIRFPNEKIRLVSFKSIMQIKILRNIIAINVIRFFIYFFKLKKKSHTSFIGLLYSDRYTEEVLLYQLKKFCKKEKKYEIAFHPGESKKDDSNFIYNKEIKYYTSIHRNTEFNLAQSEKVKKYLSECKI